MKLKRRKEFLYIENSESGTDGEDIELICLHVCNMKTELCFIVHIHSLFCSIHVIFGHYSKVLINIDVKWLVNNTLMLQCNKKECEFIVHRLLGLKFD